MKKLLALFLAAILTLFPACAVLTNPAVLPAFGAIVNGLATAFIQKGKTEPARVDRRDDVLAAAAALRAANGEGVDKAQLRAALLHVDDSQEWIVLREALIAMAPEKGGKPINEFVLTAASNLEIAASNSTVTFSK